MNTPHKHAEIIKAWADGEIIQYRPFHTWEWEDWVSQTSPSWHEKIEYRIKPKLKEVFLCSFDGKERAWEAYSCQQIMVPYQIKVTFDEKAKNIEAVEVINYNCPKGE